MHDEISDLPADNLLQVLSIALARITGSYQEFSSRLSPDNPKDFTAHHNACKAALVHLGTLIKLHELLRKNERKSNPDASEDIESLLREARSFLLATDRKNDYEENQL